MAISSSSSAAAVPPVAAADPTVFLYRDHAYVTVQVPEDTLLSYVSDPSCIFTRNSSGNEYAVILTQQEPTPPIVDVTATNGEVYRGRLVSQTPKVVTIDRFCGGHEAPQSVLRKWTGIYREIQEVSPAVTPLPDSYTLNYTGSDNSSVVPKTTYLTEALNWTPVLRLEVSRLGRGSLLTLAGVITSRMKESLYANIHVVAFDDAEGEERGRPPRFLAARATAGSSPSSSQEVAEPGTGEFIYEISKCDLIGTSRVPIFERRADVRRVHFIGLKPGQNYEERDTATTVGYVFDTLFPFPSCPIDLIDGAYQARRWMPAKPNGVVAFTKAYKSNKVSYRAVVAESSAVVSTPGEEEGEVVKSTVFTTTIDLQITPDKMDTTHVSISYKIGDVKVLKVTPKPVSGMLTPGKINWKANVPGGRPFDARLQIVWER